MTVTVAQVRTLAGASVATMSNAAAEAYIAVAQKLIAAHVGEASVPDEIRERATLLVAVEQFNQDEAPNGVVNQVFTDGLGDTASTPVRIGRDPMKPAYPILAPYVSGRFFCA